MNINTLTLAELSALTMGCHLTLNEYADGGLWGYGDVTPLIDRVSGGLWGFGDAPVNVPQDPWDGLAGVWPLNTASPCQDVSRYNHVATGLPTITLSDGPACEWGCHFPGEVSAYLLAPSDLMENHTPFSVSCWVRVDDPQFNTNVFVGRGTVFYLGRTSIHTLYAGIKGVSGNYYEAWGAPTLQTDKWYHVAATWDCHTLRVYQHGVLVANEPTPENIAHLDGGISIGAVDAGAPLWGNLSMVKIWASCVSDWSGEIASIASGGLYDMG